MKKSILGIILAGTLVIAPLAGHMDAYANDSVPVYDGSAATGGDDTFSEDDCAPGPEYSVGQSYTLTNNEAVIATNAGTVVNNFGTVEKNFGTVTNNSGTVTNNYVSNKGGTVTGSNNALSTYYNIVFGNGGTYTNASDIDNANNLLWLKGVSPDSPTPNFITVKAMDGKTLDYAVDGNGKIDFSRFTKNQDGTWTLSGINSPLSFYFKVLMTDPNPAPTQQEEKAEPVKTDGDMFKSEAPKNTVISMNALGGQNIYDLKVHATDARTAANQQLLAQTLVRSDVKIIDTKNLSLRNKLPAAEEGSAQILCWNNLPKNEPGPVYGVVYNQKDGAYVLDGTLDLNGAAIFDGFKLRKESTITICK